MLRELTAQGKKTAVIAVDPTSPFSFGSLLGDRLRMAEHFNHPGVFIRSLATRGSLGGLSAKIIEITDIFRAADFDFIIVETVGVGQSEVEIAGLADTTVLVLVPEAGDEVQTIKSGIMEIADLFVVNKSDREGADIFVKNLQQLLHIRAESKWKPAVLKTAATRQEGINELLEKIALHQQEFQKSAERKAFLLEAKALSLIQYTRMRNFDRRKIHDLILERLQKEEFNLYNFVDELLADE
jgi:LAO/AO transport system kinase